MGTQTPKKSDAGSPSGALRSRTIEGVAELIKDGKASRIVVLTGAGVSTSAGIPDFRSPKTGLYANLARLNLPYAEAVFDISYFVKNPTPFYTLARELNPERFKPTVAHAFIALLSKKGLLHMLFTQNIDCLDRAAGVPPEKIIEAHGSFATQRCIECDTAYPDDLMASAIQSGDVPHCVVNECDGLVKPDIVFFGQALPKSFWKNTDEVGQADLIIIMGTSLKVYPFARLPDFAPKGVPRVLINLERVGSLGCRVDDVCILSDCDRGVRGLADALGWREELEALWKDVSGLEADRDDSEAPPDNRTKKEILQEEVEILTRAVEHTLKFSNNHEPSLEDDQGQHAGTSIDVTAKIAERPSELSTESAPGGEKDQAKAGRGPTVLGDSREQVNQERVTVSGPSEEKNSKTLEEPLNSTAAKIYDISAKIAEGPSEVSTESAPGDEKDQARAGRGPTILGDSREQVKQESDTVSEPSEAENSRTL